MEDRQIYELVNTETEEVEAEQWMSISDAKSRNDELRGKTTNLTDG
ncbi:hypothetical protein [Nostoc piscinale]|nr:hypothetical protein [Nostoc piscinale]